MHNIYLILMTDMNFYKLISRINKLSTHNRQEELGNKDNSKTIVIVVIKE
jgi:hypothetical protein